MARRRSMTCIGVSVAMTLGSVGASMGISTAQPSRAVVTNAPDGALGTWAALGTGASDLVTALAVDPIDDTLYAGGAFTTIGGVATKGIAQWNGSEWSALSGGITVGDDVVALAVDPVSRDVYAGGTFTEIGGQPAANIARWSSAGWSALGLGMNGAVNAITLDDTVYAGGAFTSAGGVGADRVAGWNGSTWTAIGSGLGGTVFDLAIDDTLYAGGSFSGLVSRFDGTGWTSIGGGATGRVNSLAQDASGDLFAGGFFSSLSGIPADSLAVWRDDTWVGLVTEMLGARIVESVLVDIDHQLVYAAGEFTGVDSLPSANIAVYDVSLGVWLPLAGSGGQGVAGTVPVVKSLAFADSTRSSLYVGGDFTSAGGVAARNIARWTWQAPQGSNTISRDYSDSSGFTLTGEGFIGVPDTGAVLIGSTPVTYTRDDSTTIRVTAWTVSPGTYTISVDGVGGRGAVGTFTRADDPTPPPPPPPPPPPSDPPGPPTNVVAVAGNESALVSWDPPSNPGSTPITAYEVRATPLGACAVEAPETNCTIAGLDNGTSYFFIVRAVNSIGPGDYSLPSDPVVPTPPAPPPPPVDPTILITGTRGEVRGKPGVIVRGTTTGFRSGAQLTPVLRFPGPKDYAPGKARPRVNEEGGVTWQRRTRKKVYVYLRSANERFRSNRVVIPGIR